MKDKDYSSYAPEKHTPKALRGKAKSQAFIKSLMEKHGITEEQLYPEHPERNKYHSEMRI